MRTKSVVVVLALALVLTLTSYVGRAQQKDLYTEFELLSRIVQEVQDKYVDDVDKRKLFEGAIKGMLAELDPYSQYITREMLEEFKIDTEGQFGGLGIEIGLRDGILTVLTPIVGTPAFKAGVMAGDRILKIDGKPTEGITLKDAVGKLRGKPGDKVTLTVLHEGAQSPEEITLAREIIQVPSVQLARLVDEEAKIGYVHVTNFQEKTAASLDEAVKKLEKEGMKALVLDLRFNPGGLLSSAIEVADLFIDKGIIVATKGRKSAQNDTHDAKSKGTYRNFPMVVLINKGSASASEIVAGAIRDHKRGLLLGEKTWGKGSVQSVIQLEGGKSALKLTTAKYYTPSGECIHEKGIQPDIEVKLTTTQMKSLGEYMSRLHVDENRPPKDNRKNSESKGESKDAAKRDKPEAADKEPADVQLQRAVDMLKAVQVYQKLQSS
ncbi:MAG: S41 family peptidase [Planctomycetes bacterium]|nr:S41 family peptidase [Planctomycetota bacterium]